MGAPQKGTAGDVRPGSGPWLRTYNGLLPLARIGVSIAARRDRKVARREADAIRSVHSAAAIVDRLRRDGRTVVLMHAASAGEFEQLKPILRRMDRDRHILVQSFFSPTVYDREGSTPLVDTTCYHPLDFFDETTSFFNLIRPAHYLITRHDLWPNHLARANASGITTTLINGNLHSDSMRLKRWARPANREWLSPLDRVLTGTDDLAQRWQQLVPPDRIEVTGDTRFDQVWERAEKSTGVCSLPGKFRENRKAIVFGSLIESDEPVVLDGLRRAFPAGDSDLRKANHRLLVVPHEVDERTLRRFETMLAGAGFRSCRLGDLDHYGDEDTIVVDTVGILPELYGHGHAAYVGGGFGPGVHSVIEPAAHACAMTFGPNIAILEEALEIHEASMAQTVRGGEELAAFLKQCLASDEWPQAQGQILAEYVRRNTGASDRVIRSVFETD